ncbi:MAG: GTPase Era [Saprospiraceae bacterium]
MENHAAGFVNIIGRPNVGKSTLMNALVGERMSIITRKPQTTRHRIFGILNGDDFQIVFSDTPGIIGQANYQMQKAMNAFVFGAFEDADVLLWMIDPFEEFDDENPLLKRMQHAECPVFLIVNKSDLLKEGQEETIRKNWEGAANFAQFLFISAKEKRGTKELMDILIATLPKSPPYFPKDQLTDRNERFFVSEIIREQLLLQYKKEIPYSCEVFIESFKDPLEGAAKPITVIRAVIFVVRATQKNIIIGSKGAAIKQLGIDSRREIEQFLERSIYLELFVKVKDNWRDDASTLKQFGYT